MKDKPVARGESRNPLSRHPIGTTAGGVVGAVAAGAVAGTVAGPVGMVAGAVLGAAAGGMAGNMFADLIDPEAESAFWREQWHANPVDRGSTTYERDWDPAYRYGVSAFVDNPDRPFEELEPELAGGWETARGESSLSWDDARMASLDAWQRARDLAHRDPH